jgi:hypothetical protein
LEEVAEQNQTAARAAAKVKLTTDQCFDEGGMWDVTVGECVMGGATPSGVRGLFSD